MCIQTVGQPEQEAKKSVVLARMSKKTFAPEIKTVSGEGQKPKPEK